MGPARHHRPGTPRTPQKHNTSAYSALFDANAHDGVSLEHVNAINYTSKSMFKKTIFFGPTFPVRMTKQKLKFSQNT